MREVEVAFKHFSARCMVPICIIVHVNMRHDGLLTAIGAHVRRMREQRQMSRRQLSEVSGVSERFLAQLEAGKGNISLRRFADVADALHVSPASLLHDASSDNDHGVVALLGLRGAGKSTIGARLATHFGVPFIEVDARIEHAAGLGLSEIFELHGEAYYRRLEREVLTQLLRRPSSMIIATGGSIVTDRDNFALLNERTRTVWLRASPEDHWNRVIQQGDARPMAENPQAFSELRTLLSTRESLYARAHHHIDTSGRDIADVAQGVAAAVADALVPQ